MEVPFMKQYELNDEQLHFTGDLQKSKADIWAGPLSALPGQPRVALNNSGVVSSFLLRDLVADDLEKIAPRLWLMSTPSSTNISPLHHQRVKGREIIVTESPRLHLVWYYDRIYIKPLPAYLLNHSFWTDYLCTSEPGLRMKRALILRCALGFVRTYHYLCRHESDFDVAHKMKLVPPSCNWTSFSNFINGFSEIDEGQVANRYHYGELRLTRLNFWAKIWLHRFQYEQVHGQYAAYFASFYAPWLVTFAILSVVISAMQLEVGAEQTSASYTHSRMLPEWPEFAYICRWFSIVCLALVLVTLFLYGMILCYMILDEVIWTGRKIMKRRAHIHEDIP